MPGFISHTVMARDVYNKLSDNDIPIDYMMTYSLGGDLCKYAKCRYDSHHKDQDKFIYNMADYIKKNDLVNDKKMMAVLYGHICHYVMDDTVHPLVRKMTKTCLRNKKNHTLIEEYYDTYLVKARTNVSKKEYIKKKVVNARVDREIAKMLNHVYMETYNTKNVANFYRINLFLYRRLCDVYRLINSNLIDKITGLSKFLTINKNIDLVNDKQTVTYRNSLMEEYNQSLLDLYDESVLLALAYIKKINKYLKTWQMFGFVIKYTTRKRGYYEYN